MSIMLKTRKSSIEGFLSLSADMLSFVHRPRLSGAVRSPLYDFLEGSESRSSFGTMKGERKE